MRVLFFVVIMAFLVASCKRDDLNGADVVSGILYIKTGLNGSLDSSAVPGVTLYLQDGGGNGSGYLYAVTTDLAGKYLFTNLQKSKKYRIHASLDSIGIEYNVDTTIKVSNINQALILYPDNTAQDGFSVHAQDSSNTPIANLKLWVFTSSVLAQANDSIGSIFTLVTDDSGNAYRLNIDTAYYYINVNDTIGAVVFSAKETVHVSPNIISLYNFTIK